MVVLEYILIAVLIIAAFVIIGAVLIQKSNEGGLSGTIAGGAETFYGKDKSSHTDRVIFKWTVISGIVFASVVLLVYIIQPDYSQGFSLEEWANSYLNNYSHIVGE